jgi:hypothetical protein
MSTRASIPTTTAAPTTAAFFTQTVTPESTAPTGPCEIVAERDVTVYNRPSTAAAVFGSVPAGFRIFVEGKTADGWWGFEPGVAQAANMGVFRLRWVEGSSGVRLEGACNEVPELVGPPAGVCFTMPMQRVPVYAEPDVLSAIITTMSPGNYAAVISSITDDWVEVDLGPGNTRLDLRGWVQGITLNLNGPCEVLPAPPPVATATPAPTPTAATPPILTPTPSGTSSADCSDLPTGSFLAVWQSDADLQALLGCPTSYHPRIEPAAWEVQTSYQPFERGAMMWSDHIGWYAQPVVYVLYTDGTYQRFEDTFDPAVDSASGGETPPNGLVEPALGFGKVWCDQPGVREVLGWATANETAGVGRFQTFLGGAMVWINQTNQTYVFSNGAVYVFDVPFSEE